MQLSIQFCLARKGEKVNLHTSGVVEFTVESSYSLGKLPKCNEDEQHLLPRAPVLWTYRGQPAARALIPAAFGGLVQLVRSGQYLFMRLVMLHAKTVPVACTKQVMAVQNNCWSKIDPKKV